MHPRLQDKTAALLQADSFPKSAHAPLRPLRSIFKENPGKRRLLIGLPAALGACLAFAAVASADDEAVFKAVKQYTVKVRTQVSVPFSGDKKGAWIGAGFLVDKDRGWIVTNAHVATRSHSVVRVAFHDGEYVPVRKVFVDPYVDLAVLELPEQARHPATAEAELDCRSVPDVGHPVGAFGHPWRLHFTGTRGIVSGRTAKYEGMIEMIQADAPMDPGNSGGPLVSLKTGKVVGINTARRRNSQGTNFAVPIYQACRVLDLLRANADPSPPDLPVSFLHDPEEPRKLVVAKVHEDEPTLGLLDGDVITGIAGEDTKIANRGHLLHALRGRGKSVQLRVQRGGEETVVPVELKPAARMTERRGVQVSGMLLAPFPHRGLGGILRKRSSLIVHEVEGGSEAQSEYVEGMDVLDSVDGVEIDTMDDLYGRLKGAAGRKVLFKFIRLDPLNPDLFSYTEAKLPITDLRWIGPSQ